MYLNYLSDDQQRVFVDAAVLLIRSDERLAVEEADLLETIRTEVGREVPGPDVELALDDALAEVGEAYLEPAQRDAFMIGLAAVCVVDREVHKAEVALLWRYAKALGMKRKRMDELVAFAARG